MITKKLSRNKYSNKKYWPQLCGLCFVSFVVFYFTRQSRPSSSSNNYSSSSRFSGRSRGIGSTSLAPLKRLHDANVDDDSKLNVFSENLWIAWQNSTQGAALLHMADAVLKESREEAETDNHPADVVFLVGGTPLSGVETVVEEMSTMNNRLMLYNITKKWEKAENVDELIGFFADSNVRAGDVVVDTSGFEFLIETKTILKAKKTQVVLVVAEPLELYRRLLAARPQRCGKDMRISSVRMNAKHVNIDEDWSLAFGLSCPSNVQVHRRPMQLVLICALRLIFKCIFNLYFLRNQFTNLF